jgi:bifunctional enzyme CysN/CysC
MGAGERSLLRFITCGSVDDGKSTLIGRLLHDCGAVPADQLAALGPAPDYSLLFDGLAAEREQGITIDVAYRYFATPARKFIVADTPGHEQYTRNMVTGASTADLAVVLVDATRGVLTQTRRHAYLVKLLGIRQVVLAVTKMDLVGFAPEVFDAIAADFAFFADEIGSGAVTAIPLSGASGDNVCARSERMDWYGGPTLIAALEGARVADEAEEARPLRMPVQGVTRDGAFRGLSGLIAAGTVAPGDAVRVLPSGQRATVARIVDPAGDRQLVVAGQSAMLTLAEPVDCARGDVIVAADDPPGVADRFEATIVWLADEPLIPGRGYWLKLATQTVSATVQPPKYEINVDTLEQLAARTLELNAIGVAEVATDRPVVFEPYAESRTLGGFILISKLTGATVAAGMLHFALRRATNIHWQATDVTREARAVLMHQRPAVLWFTGLSGAGKSTIANLVEKKLHALGRHTFLLDGDNVRHGLNKDLGFTEADRIENIRRVGEVARLMADAGLIVIAAFISPFAAERALVRAMIPAGEFIEVHVDTPLAEAEARDAKGLYAKARAGELKNFTGIDSPYEPPQAPEIRIDTLALSAEEAADAIVARLLEGDAA